MSGYALERDRRRPIIFIDFDGTICNDRYWRTLPSDKQNKLQTYLFQESRDVVFEWMRGLHTAEEFNNLVAVALDTPYSELWQIASRCMFPPLLPGSRTFG
ncbi:hypothetical protein V7799_01110 [Rhizobium laguerreae]